MYCERANAETRTPATTVYTKCSADTTIISIMRWFGACQNLLYYWKLFQLPARPLIRICISIFIYISLSLSLYIYTYLYIYHEPQPSCPNQASSRLQLLQSTMAASASASSSSGVSRALNIFLFRVGIGAICYGVLDSQCEICYVCHYRILIWSFWGLYCVHSKCVKSCASVADARDLV